jgi:histone-lysine N-methyltransferase SETMAR
LLVFVDFVAFTEPVIEMAKKQKTLTREQIRLLLHYEWLQGTDANDAAKKINKTYGLNTVGRRTAYDWYARFRKEGMQLKDKAHTGRPRTIDREAVLNQIRANPTMTTRMLADDFNCHHSAIEEILHEAGLKWRKTRLVPYSLTDAQRQKRVDVATKLLERQRQVPFVQNVITMDETWLPFNNPDPHKAWLLPNQRAPATPSPDFRQKKIMLSVFWDSTGVIGWGLVDRTVNSEVYCAQLDRVAEALLDSGREEPVIFLHDNASSHTSKMTKNKLADLGWEVLPHPPYSPDMAPSDFHLFTSLKGWLKGKRFSNVQEAENAVQEYFNSKPIEFYARAFSKLPDIWEEIIGFDGDYV